MWCESRNIWGESPDLNLRYSRFPTQTAISRNECKEHKMKHCWKEKKSSRSNNINDQLLPKGLFSTTDVTQMQDRCEKENANIRFLSGRCYSRCWWWNSCWCSTRWLDTLDIAGSPAWTESPTALLRATCSWSPLWKEFLQTHTQIFFRVVNSCRHNIGGKSDFSDKIGNNNNYYYYYQFYVKLLF